MSHIYDDGVEAALARLDSPDRVKRHDPAMLFSRARIKAGETLADLGCGTGFFALPAARILGSKGLVLAVDRVPEALARLKQKVEESGLTNVKVIQADATATRIESGSVDTVLMANVLHDVEKHSIISELKRILKRQGRIIVVDWRKVADPQVRGPPVELRLSPSEATSIMEMGGWKVSDSFDLSASHYAIVAE